MSKKKEDISNISNISKKIEDPKKKENRELDDVKKHVAKKDEEPPKKKKDDRDVAKKDDRDVAKKDEDAPKKKKDDREVAKKDEEPPKKKKDDRDVVKKDDRDVAKKNEEPPKKKKDDRDVVKKDEDAPKKKKDDRDVAKKNEEPPKKKKEDHRYKKESDNDDSSEDNNDDNEYYPFLDPSYIEQHTKDYEKLRVYLKKSYKGVSLFAREPIKKGQIVSYYKIKVMSERSKVKRVKDGIYTFNIYSKDDEKLKKYYGDICLESLEKPRRGIPFFGYFANEPSNGQVCNTTVDINLKENYSDRDEVRTGDFMIYRLIALRDISIDDEICWYYGDHYDRDYDISDRTR